MAFLPDEILYMICTQLRHQRALNTLLNCACSGKELAEAALKNLYRYPTCNLLKSRNHKLIESRARIHDVAIFVDGSFDRVTMDEQRRGKQCAGRWRTIILSSLGKTLYPYTQYIRTLDLRGLENLLSIPGLGCMDRQ